MENDDPDSTPACTPTSARCSFLSSDCSIRIESVRISGRPALIRPAICLAKTASAPTLTRFSNPGIEIS